MNMYIGTKMVQAEPATRGEAWARKSKLNEAEVARIIEQMPEDGYRVRYPDGYESWSPKDVFDAAYRPVNAMTFGLAIEAMKQGKKVARAGWNGKKQYIELASNISYRAPEGCIVNCEHAAIGNQAIAFVGTSGVQMGWLASQSDMLAEDWYIVQEAE